MADLEAALAEAIRAEHVARATGAEALQALHMDQIRQLRAIILEQRRDDAASLRRIDDDAIAARIASE